MKIKTTLLVLLMIVFVNNVCVSQPPQWLWGRQAIGSGSVGARGTSVVTDGFGNIYVTGFFGYNGSTTLFDSVSLVNSWNTDMFIVKYNSNGNVIWAKSASGPSNEYGESIAIDPQGNIYITGYFDGSTMSFGTITLTNTSPVFSSNMFLVKYDSNGNVLWARSSGGNSGSDRGNAVATDDAGNIYVTGRFSDSTITFGAYNLILSGGSGLDMFIIKYSNSGTVLWAKSEGGIYDESGESVTTDIMGNVYVTGYFDSYSFAIDSSTLTTIGGNDLFIVKYGSGGNVLWAKSAGGLNSDIPSSIKADGLGNIYITGSFTTAINFDSIFLQPLSFNNMFIVKYDFHGNAIWAKSGSGGCLSYGSSVAMTLSGVNVIGGFNSNCPLILGSDTLLAPAGTHAPLFIVNYDLNGNEMCASSLDGGGSSANEVTTDNLGNSYITGEFHETPFIIGADTLSQTVTGINSPLTFYIAKYNCNGSSSSFINEFDNQQTTINISPNPFTSQTTITFSEEQKNTSLIITDVLGNTILQSTINTKQSTLDMSGFAKGIYFVRIVSAGSTTNVVNRKIIKE